jgi:hypothetical protein
MNGNTAFLNHQLIFPRVQLAKQQTDNQLKSSTPKKWS